MERENTQHGTFRDLEKMNPEFAGKFSDTDDTLESRESKPEVFDGDISEEPVNPTTNLETDRMLGVLENPDLQDSIKPIPLEKGPRPEKVKRGPSWRQQLLAIGAALGLNTAGMLAVDSGLRSQLIEDGRGALARATETDADKAALAAQAAELLEQKDKEKVVEERLELFLKVLGQRGGVSEEDIEITRNFFHGIQDEFKKIVQTQGSDDEEKKSTLFELVKKFGRYDVHFARLSDVAEKQKFNCEVLAQSLLVTIQAMYPDMIMKLQWFGGDEVNVPHVRVVVKIGGKWYAVEKNGPEELSLKDIKGTVITGPEAFEKSLVEKVGEGAKVEKKVLSADSNSVFGISFANAKVFEGGNTKEESDDEYQARMRSKYVGGKPLDPENLPPMTMYMGNTVEEVATDMGGVGRKKDQKIVDTLKPEDPHPLPEEVIIKAIMEGELRLSRADNIFYDFSSLDGIPINTLQFSFGTNTAVNKKFVDEFQKRFSHSVKVLAITGRDDFSFIQSFSLLETISLEGSLTDISFLSDKIHLTSVQLRNDSLDKGDLMPLHGLKLRSLDIGSRFYNYKELNTENLREVNIKVIAENRKEAESLVASAPLVEHVTWFCVDSKVLDPFGSIDHFASSKIKKVELLMLDENTFGKADFSKFRGQPIEDLSVVGFNGDIKDLKGAPLKTIHITYDGTPLEFFASEFVHLEDIGFLIQDIRPVDTDQLTKMKNLKTFQWWNDTTNGIDVRTIFSKSDLHKMSGLHLTYLSLPAYGSKTDFGIQDIVETVMDKKDSTIILPGEGIFSLKKGVLTQTSN